MASITLTEESNLADIIPDNDVKKVSYISYLAAFIVGTLIPVSGLASPQIAAHFNVNVSHVVYIDVLTLIGLIIGNVFSGKTIEKIGGKNTLAFSGLLLLVAQYAMGLQNMLVIYAACVLVSGFGIGFMVPSVSYLIVGAFQRQKKSDAKLSILNFFFSIGSFAGPFIGGWVIKGFGWRSAFIITGTLGLIMFLTSFLTKIQETIGVQKPVEEKNSVKTEKSKVVTLGVLLVGLGLIAYVYLEYIVSYWFSPYLQMDLKYNVGIVGTVIGTYWLSVAIGRFVFGEFVLAKVKNYKFVVTVAIVTFVGFVLFLTFNNIVAVFLCTALLGFGCASIFPTMLGFGMQLNKVNPLTTAFLIGCGSLGGAISLFVSGTVGEHLTKKTAIYMGPVCCILIIVFVLLAHMQSKKKALNK